MVMIPRGRIRAEEMVMIPRGRSRAEEMRIEGGMEGGYAELSPSYVHEVRVKCCLLQVAIEDSPLELGEAVDSQAIFEGKRASLSLSPFSLFRSG
ncbi:hypothetical protein SAY87_021023 [Trapa incisa]|uniref:Uncharacterized protein n=1 Tax=Trapa incisa TaxID=236973 RepID=A0AAN7PV83_9MYRT|nr:hypothetical protein SAY87_021023 [Trapa incisa]